MAVGTLARFCYSHVRISERSRTLECARSVNDSVLVLPLRRTPSARRLCNHAIAGRIAGLRPAASMKRVMGAKLRWELHRRKLRESPPGWSHPFDQIHSNHRKLESQLYFDQCLSSPPKSTGITPVNRTTFVGACRFEELLTSRERSSAFTPTGAASPRSDRPHQQVWIRRRST